MFIPDYDKRGQMTLYPPVTVTREYIMKVFLTTGNSLRNKKQRQQTINLDTADTDGFSNIHIIYYLLGVFFTCNFERNKLISA
jgi:hypothetical protein